MVEPYNAVLDKEALYDICFRNGKWVTGGKLLPSSGGPGARLCQHGGLFAAPSFRMIDDVLAEQ